MENNEVLEVKKKITRKRVDIQNEKAKVEKFGEETDAIIPDDLLNMYAGKICNLMVKNSVRASNMLSGYERQYPTLDKHTLDTLTQLNEQFEKDFEKSKNLIKKIVETDPLYMRLKGIKGFTAYQLALVKSYIKDIERFDTPSKLMVYAGIGCINGMAVTKANINKIKQYYHEQGRTESISAKYIYEDDCVLIDNAWVEVKNAERTDSSIVLTINKQQHTFSPEDRIIRQKEFKGFNTELAGRMFVITDCLMRAGGFFYTLYTQIRKTLTEKQINSGNIELFKDKYYMKGKKNQSLDLFTDKGAKRRIARILLHFIWAEWRALKGLPIRHPYAIEYLAHQHEITLAQALLADSKK